VGKEPGRLHSQVAKRFFLRRVSIGSHESLSRDYPKI
jgi:hypothetical protein